MYSAFFRNAEYNIASSSAGIFLEIVAGRRKTGESMGKTKVQGNADAVSSLMYSG
jgi:hypothetical protein